MNPQRSRSRERVQNPSFQKTQQHKNQELNLNRKHETGFYQRGSSNERHPQQRLSSNPAQYPLPQKFPNQPNQYLKSSSPNKMMQPESILPVYGNPKQNTYSNLISRPQMIMKKEPSMGKIEKIEDLANQLRKAKKPFSSSQAVNLQVVLQRLASKYSFDQIYQTFVYFFIHSSTLDQNLYKVFYSLISNNNISQGMGQKYLHQGIGQKCLNQGMGQQYLPRFYDTLIRATLKSSFEQFKRKIDQLQEVKVEDYFRLDHELREKVVNRSLYQMGQSPFGCSIRNILTLIRKAMQKQKTLDKNGQSQHPIRQVLKVLKSITKSMLRKIFLPEAQNKQQTSQLSQQQKDRQKVLHLILISQLSLIIHFKYRHHIHAEFEQTLNEMTILKMNMTEIEQKIRSINIISKDNDKIISKDSEKRPLVVDERTTLENLKKEHQNNYLYLFFVLNLSSYHNPHQYDQNLFWFYAKPFLEEYSRSSDFLLQKIQQNPNKFDQNYLFANIIKNFGLYEDNFNLLGANDVEFLRQNNLRLQRENQGSLAKFINQSRSTILLNCLYYAAEDRAQQLPSNTLSQKKFLLLFNALSPLTFTFSKIKKNFQIKDQVNVLRKGTQTSHEQSSLQQQKLSLNYIDEDFDYLLDPEVELLRNNISGIQNQLNQLIPKVFSHKINFDPAAAETNKNTQTIELDNKDQPKYKTKTKQLRQLKNFFHKLSLTMNGQSYISLLGLVYLLFKQNKWQQAKKSILKINQSIDRIKKKQTQNTDLTMAEENSQKSAIGLKNILRQLIEKVAAQIDIINQTEVLMIKLIQEQLSKTSSVKENTQSMIKFIRKVMPPNTSGRNKKLSARKNKLTGLPCSILSIFIYQLISQQKSQQDKLMQVIYKFQEKIEVSPQNQECYITGEDRIIQEKDEKIEEKDQEIEEKDEKIEEKDEKLGKTTSLMSQAEYLVNELILNLRKYLQLTEKFTHQQSFLSTVEKNLIQKKSKLIKRQLLSNQLPFVLDKIKAVYQGPSNSQAQLLRRTVLVQSLIEKVTLSLFKLRQESSKSFSFLNQQNIENNQNKVEVKRQQFKNYSTRDIAASFGLKPFIDQYSNSQTNALKPSIKLTRQIQQFVSEILSTLYFNFKSPACSILQQTNPQEQQKPPTLKSIISLQQILVQKLKKFISLYYDKINQNMINQFIINRKLFILRVLVITFYKIKSLSEAFINKFAAFSDPDHLEANQESQKIRKFVRQVFFIIKDQRLLQPYMTFLITKDKFHLKAQLVSCIQQNHEQTNHMISHFFQIL